MCLVSCPPVSAAPALRGAISVATRHRAPLNTIVPALPGGVRSRSSGLAAGETCAASPLLLAAPLPLRGSVAASLFYLLLWASAYLRVSGAYSPTLARGSDRRCITCAGARLRSALQLACGVRCDRLYSHPALPPRRRYKDPWTSTLPHAAWRKAKSPRQRYFILRAALAPPPRYGLWLPLCRYQVSR